VSKVIEITDKNFEEEVLRSDIPTEVDFWAPWCGPCMMVSPIYDKLANEYDGKFKFCKINVDKNQRMAAKYQVMSIPMQKFFVDGEKVDEILGAVPESTIRAMVAGIIDSYPTGEKGKLKRILSLWVENKVQDVEGEQIYNDASGAVAEFGKLNERLSRMMSELSEEN
jgi:thioredoxin 1